MTTQNNFKTYYDLENSIKSLEYQVKTLKKEQGEALEKILLSGKKEQGKYHLVETIRTRRVPVADRVIETIGETDALKIASFQIKDLEKLLSKDVLDTVCNVSESKSLKVIYE